MKKFLMAVLQILSLLFFIVLITAVVGVVREIIKQSDKGLAFNLGYGLCAVVVIGLLFWLNFRFFKWVSK